MNFARCKCDRRATQSLMRSGAFALQLGKEFRLNADRCWLMMLIWVQGSDDRSRTFPRPIARALESAPSDSPASAVAFAEAVVDDLPDAASPGGQGAIR
jgi:hypothetical protein